MRAIHVVLPALLLAGCGMLYAEVEIPTVELTLPKETIPGSGGDTTFDKIFTYDLGKDISVITENDVTVTLRLQSLTIASDAVDLYGVQALTVRVEAPTGSALPSIDLIAYARPAGATAPIRSVEAVASGGEDLGPYLTAGALKLHVAGSGAPPVADWLGRVTAAFYLKVRYPYGKQIKL